MNFDSIIIGFILFLIIGIFHPIVIKAEYYFSKKVWWVFLVAGLIFGYFSLIYPNKNISIILSILAFTCFWSIKEVIEQEGRVKKGFAPKNPKRKY